MIISKDYFKKKNIIITGANQGLGLEIAKYFYQLGANVIICARDKKKLNNIKRFFKKKKKKKKK